jgi:O-methyltransferase
MSFYRRLLRQVSPPRAGYKPQERPEQGKQKNTVYDVVPNLDERPGRQKRSFPDIRDPLFWELYDRTKRYSMLQVTGLHNLYQSIRYIAANQIPGNLIECGVFLGGTSIFAALCMRHMGLTSRKLFLSDTFEGFPAGSSDIKKGQVIAGPHFDNFADIVRSNIKSELGEAPEIELVPGDVAKTLPKLDTGPLSLVTELYPKLVPGGVLIVDDYGIYEGSRRATDEYLGGLPSPPLFSRVDNAIWFGIKPGVKA